MIVCPVAYGEVGLQMLDLWWRFYHRSGSRCPVVPLLYGASQSGCLTIPDLGEFEPFTYHLNIAGALKASSCKIGGDDARVVCDCDLVFLSRIEELVADSKQVVSVGMVPMYKSRFWKSWPEAGQEVNYGLAYLPSRSAAEAFKDTYLTSLAEGRTKERITKVPYFDEIVASHAFYSLGGTKLPPRWNHSLYHEGKPTTTFHGHGPEGKRALAALAKDTFHDL